MVTTLLLILTLFINYTANVPDQRIITTLKYSNKYAHPTIVHGIPAKWGQVPYIVSIKEPLVRVSKQNNMWTNLCGGSIISPRKVLTAAHCFESNNFYYKTHPEKLRVVAGEFLTELIHTGNTYTTEKCQWRKIANVKIHPNFYFPENDLAVVYVSKPWVFKENVDYILPARRNIDYPTACTAAGFGSYAQANYRPRNSPVLLVAQMFLLTRKNCSTVWEVSMDKFICTYSFMSDVSEGDSGGPLVCKGTNDPTEKLHNKRELLVGVVSGKNFDKTSIFTRVAAYRNWMDNIDTNLGRRTQLSLITLTINYILLSSYEVYQF